MLRAKKLKGSAIIQAAAAHNKRTIQAESGASGSIDATRSRLNECLAGPATPGEVAENAQVRARAAGVVKMRKDAVRAIEFVVSLAPSHGIDERAFSVQPWYGWPLDSVAPTTSSVLTFIVTKPRRICTCCCCR